jgi:uncharacterized membrane protein YhaH (DUF805 family)
MDIVQSIQTCLTKYIDFTGRATRSEFWWFQLFLTVVINIGAYFNPRIGLILYLILLLPALAVMVRRFHDTDRSGWWILLILIPVIGWLVILCFMISKGTDGKNRFDYDFSENKGPK